ncbi:MAG: class I SAM-dependent methyltransferase [Verrucomicrobia bacterium]|nr:class I SAM-dependent methyltransferase [Verrucomicrobiota bacterium]
MPEDRRLQTQIDYYAARAGEYDDWFFRRGRYDRGEEASRRWFAEVAEVAAALEIFAPAGEVLELACGTGIWTERLVRHATRLVAVDASAEVLALNRARWSASGAQEKLVEHRQADIFRWEPKPDEKFDAIFFSFWLSHVPPECFDEFWSRLRQWLKPAGRVFFLDSRREPTSTAADHVLPAPDEPIMQRRLNDGRSFEIYKIFYEAAPLAARLASLGWQMEIRTTARYFLHGSGRLSAAASS